MTLPILLEPKDHEELESYLSRLAKANGLTYDEFCKSLNLNSKYDIFKFLIKQGLFNSYSEIVLNHTIYPIKAIFTNPFRQAVLLNQSYSGLNKSSSKDTTKSFICPECEYTEVYESLKGVNECHIHSKINNPEIANLCKTILTTKPDIDFFDLKMNRKNISVEEGLKVLLDKGICTEDGEFKDISPNTLVFINEYKPIQDITFEKYDPIKIDDEYEVIYNSKSLIELIHKKCGTRFLTNAFGYDMFYRCPKCCDTLENLYKRQIEKDGKYKLIKFGTNTVTLNHLSCGKNIQMQTRAFLEGTRCKCESMWTEARLDSYFKTYYPNFKPISYKDETITLMHSECKEKFSKNLSKWFKNPQCPICNPRTQLNNQTVKEKVEELGFNLENEFIDFRKKIEISCKKGHKRNVKYYTFLNNPVCPTCIKRSKNSKKNNIISFIEDNYSEDDIVFIADLPAATSSTYKDVFKELGMYQIANGAYSKNYHHEDEIIIAKYIGKNNSFGYFYGKCFAHELGFCEEPTMFSIATIREKAPDARIVSYANKRIRLKTVSENFNQSNFREIQMADFISGINVYAKNPFDESIYTVLKNHIDNNDLNLKTIEDNLTKNNRWTKFIMDKLYETKK